MRAVLSLAFVFLAASCVSSPPERRNPRPAAAPPPHDLEQQIAALEAASRPGPMHRKLEPLVGEWETTIMQLGSGGGESPGPTGLTSIRPMFGGRYLRWEARMPLAGQTQETSGWLGFDLNAGEYQLCMITSFSSGMGIYRGSGDLARDGILFALEQVDPKSGGRVSSRNRLALLAPDHFVIEDLDEDRRVRARSHYRRRK